MTSADSVEFGYFLVPNAADALIDLAREVERLGLEWVGIQDHPYQRRFVDTFALMSAVLTATTSLRVFPDVACLPLRPPGVLAKTAASLDVLASTDRKSTRLNSSHVKISYAVFCLKKKKIK